MPRDRRARKFGKVLVAVRDAESRTRFLGYRVEHYKLFVFALSACMAGVAGALYVPQVGIINPSEFRRQLDRDRKVAARLKEIGNATPLISIEGREITSDERRGKKDVFNKTLRGLENCLKVGLLTGVATSVCQSNIDELLNESWLQELINRGVHYVWYHTYRPVGPKMNAQLALRPEQLVRTRKFVVEMRAKMPIAIIDAYYDHKGQALCPMSTGISHHISPRGDIEPCPIIQFATETIRDSRGIYETMSNSAFLKDFRELSAHHTRGCVVLERPDLVKDLVHKHGARDTTVRGTAMAELEAMTPRFSQWLPGEEVAEKHWMYRLAKKYWFSDFNAYAKVAHDAESKARALKTSLDPVKPVEA